ncbi:MAG: tagaturonate reductase, partial [Spirochaetota bacterium]
ENELPLKRAGLNIVWTEDLPSYRTRKVKVLNGLHTMTVLASYLSGCDTVRESAEDSIIGPYMRIGAFDEILPTIDMDEKEKINFAEEVFERFKNPFMRHYCLSIALNSVSKFRVRVLPSLTDYYEKSASIPKVLSFSLAALAVFYRVHAEQDGTFAGIRGGISYPVKDDEQICRFFLSLWESFSISGDCSVLSEALLSNSSFWGRDLTQIPGLAQYCAACIRCILEHGMKDAVSRCVRGEIR